MITRESYNSFAIGLQDLIRLLVPRAIGVEKDSLSVEVGELVADPTWERGLAKRDITIRCTLFFNKEEVQNAIEHNEPITIERI